MLLDLVVQSIHEFQSDCLNLFERDYPAVHNRGMAEQHLGQAFSRRLCRTLDTFSQPHHFATLEKHKNSDQPHRFRISTEHGTVWLITHHVVSAGKNCREALLRDIHEWQAEYCYAIQPNDLLLVISDHWLSRSKNSRELLHWWMGELPDAVNEYAEQGITLYQSDSQLSQEIENRFSLAPCFLKYGHPLKRLKDQQMVRKYLQLYAVVQWQ